MKRTISAISKRIFSIFLLAVLITAQAFAVISIKPENKASAYNGSLEVRVQYEGWRADKIPTIATFSSSELLGMGSSVHQYTNITDVDTLMRIVAKGPKVTDVISAAGIDLSSVSYIIFRTTDGNGKDGRYSCQFTIGELQQKRYYYPNLPNNYQTDNNKSGIMPNEGSLSGAVSVPTILALSYYTTKNDKDDISSGKCRDHSLLRICLGQTTISENKWTKGGYSGDVTSHMSVDSIYGMDVILKGSPLKGMELGLDNPDLKVGSSAKITVSATGDEAFSGDFNSSRMKWSSSDKSVAKVDKNGKVTIVGPGSATITATAPDGTKASIVINGSGEKKEDGNSGGKKGNKTDAKKTDKSKGKKVKSVNVLSAKELTLGDKIQVETDANQTQIETLNPEISPLGEQEAYGKGALFGTIGGTIIACGAGFAYRVRRFRIDRKGE